MAGHPFEQVLAALNAGRGLHLVVGGGAVVLHGHLRAAGRPLDLADVAALEAIAAKGDGA